MAEKNDDKFELKGFVLKSHPGATFSVRLEGIEKDVLCHLSGKMRMNNIRVLEGDTVDVEMDVYDLSRGKIIFRYKK